MALKVLAATRLANVSYAQCREINKYIFFFFLFLSGLVTVSQAQYTHINFNSISIFDSTSHTSHTHIHTCKINMQLPRHELQMQLRHSLLDLTASATAALYAFGQNVTQLLLPEMCWQQLQQQQLWQQQLQLSRANK